MIDLETVTETRAGTWFDRLSAFLIGLIAVLAALLALAQTVYGLTEGRASSMGTRLATDASAHLNATSSHARFAAGALQQAIVVSMEGTSRQIVALGGDDQLGTAIGLADANAGDRLLGIARDMGALPGEDGPLDGYARDLLSGSVADAAAIVEEQNRQVDRANEAGIRSGRAVLGLSALALAGVLVGLAAVLGVGRAGRLMLVTGYLAAIAATVALLAAVVLPVDLPA
jgi:hypothetical protein